MSKIKWLPHFCGFYGPNLSGEKVFFAILVVDFINISTSLFGAYVTRYCRLDAINRTVLQSKMKEISFPQVGT